MWFQIRELNVSHASMYFVLLLTENNVLHSSACKICCYYTMLPILVDLFTSGFHHIQGLEKYVMTKLFSRVFASLPYDVKLEDQLSEKMVLIQRFIRPENLDIKPTFQNETSWLVSI